MTARRIPARDLMTESELVEVRQRSLWRGLAMRSEEHTSELQSL